jgi:hypothetical protein
VYAFKKPSNIFWINAGGYAMTQVGDPTFRTPSLVTKSFTHRLYPVFDGILPAIKHIGIEVPLQSDLGVLDETTGDGRLDTPIEAEDVVAGVAGK